MLQPLGQAGLSCANMQPAGLHMSTNAGLHMSANAGLHKGANAGLHMGANNEQPVPELWLEVFELESC